MSRTCGAIAAAALACATEAAAGGLAITSDPVTCVPADRYARISATTEDAAAVELQFRVAGGGWYAVRMAKDGGAWVGMLPRPARGLDRFEYRIVARTADLETKETAPVGVRVGDGTPCEATTPTLPEASIVVRVPEGAPVMPPVPAGFSPAGVVAFEEKRGISVATRWVAGAGLAGVLAAGAAAAGSDAPQGSRPSFRFHGTSPASGSVLSLSRDRLSVSIQIIGGSPGPLSFVWRFELLSGGSGTPCVFMGNVASVTTPPQVVTVSDPLMPSATCGDRFETHSARLQIMSGEELAQDQILPFLFYRIEP